jgi:hypothetical protein
MNRDACAAVEQVSNLLHLLNRQDQSRLETCSTVARNGKSR